MNRDVVGTAQMCSSEINLFYLNYLFFFCKSFTDTIEKLKLDLRGHQIQNTLNWFGFMHSIRLLNFIQHVQHSFNCALENNPNVREFSYNSITIPQSFVSLKLDWKKKWYVCDGQISISKFRSFGNWMLRSGIIYEQRKTQIVWQKNECSLNSIL